MKVRNITWMVSVLTVFSLALYLVPEHYFLPIKGGSHYLSMHTLLEGASIVAALFVYSLSWSEFRGEEGHFASILCYAFLAVAILDVCHTLSYPGMPKFITLNSPEKGINFWFAARLASVMGFAGLAYYDKLPRKITRNIYIMYAITVAYISMAFVIIIFYPSILPDTFVSGVGLTQVKIHLEYVLVLVFLFLAYKIFTKKGQDILFDKSGVAGAICILALSELMFTLYTDVTDQYNLIGHIYKMIGYVLLYYSTYVYVIKMPHKKLNYIAYHDTLTGLPNRAALEERFFDYVKFTKNDKCTVSFFDIYLTNFKALNQYLGYLTGDKIIKKFADELRLCVDERIELYNISINNFIIVLKCKNQHDDINLLAKKILDLSKKAFSVSGFEYFYAINIGIGILNYLDHPTLDNVISQTDVALADASSKGKNNYAIFESKMQEALFQQLNIITHLNSAIKNGELFDYYQPQVDIKTGKIIGAEALLRWRHPVLGSVLPEIFIPLAEDSGVIFNLTKFILGKACERAKQWSDELGFPFKISVNFSCSDFSKPGIVEVVRAALLSSGLPSSQLEIELTESMLIQDLKLTNRVISDLDELDVSIAIDDFGKGYSSMAYLKDLKIDKIKIDKSFISNIDSYTNSYIIVDAIIKLTKSLELTTLAEGVETQAQLRVLKDLGCDAYQGYLLSMPVASDEFYKKFVVKN